MTGLCGKFGWYNTLELRTVLIVLLSILFAGTSVAQQVTIRLGSETPQYTATGFYIDSIIDERDDVSTIGYVKAQGTRKVPANLQNGLAASLKNYLSRKEMKGAPVSLHITSFQLSERRTKGMDIAHLEMEYVFYFEGTQLFLVNSKGDMPAGEKDIEKNIRRQADKLISEFAKWFDKNKDVLLAKPSIKVSVTTDDAPGDNNIITYSTRRKLSYRDFQGSYDKDDEYAAGTASGISMAISSLTNHRQVEVKVKVGAFFHKSESWFKKEAMNNDVLGHEQLHFDITALIACEFIEALEKHTFTPENYQEELVKLHTYFEALAHQMQTEYDAETDHGQVEDKQAAWQNKIARYLSERSCYK